MRYVSTGGAKDDTAARRLASLRTSMGKDEVKFDSDWELHEKRVSHKWYSFFMVFK